MPNRGEKWFLNNIACMFAQKRYTTMKQKKYWIYQFENFDFDTFIEKYREICNRTEIEYVDYEPYIEYIPAEKMNDDEYIESVTREKENAMKGKVKLLQIQPHKPLLSNEKIRLKCAYVMHTVIYRCSSSKISQASISSQVLKSVIGHDYRMILDTLIEMQFIEKISFINAPQYLSSEYSTNYSLNSKVKIEKVNTINRKIISYIEKTKELFNKYYDENENKLEQKYGRRFKLYYLKSLNSLKLIKQNEFDEYIKSIPNLTQGMINYYDFIKDYLKNERYRIFSIDNANRIYHVFCNLKRELKEYFNIKFVIDAKNSHALLFNYFIFYSHDINTKHSYNICKYLSTINIEEDAVSATNRYVGQKLYNILINNNIEVDSVNRLHYDEIEYIYVTTQGRLWDCFNDLHPDMNRSEVKTKMFKEVFYSNTKRIVWKSFAKEFIRKYPNVYKIIDRWKIPEEDDKIMHYIKENNIKSKKTSSALPVSMMKIESLIFTDILQCLYKLNVYALHIHDAIILPNISNNKNVNSYDVECIMKEVFKTYGLSPTFSVDIY